MQAPGSPIIRQQTELEDQHRGCIQEGCEQGLFPEEDEDPIYQSVVASTATAD